MANRKTFLRVIALLLFMTTLTGTFATGILAARDNRYDREENVTLHWCYDYVSTSNDHTKNLNLATVTYNGSAWGFGGTQTLSGNGSADIIVTPAEGYRIVSVDSLCSTGGSGNRANPYSCRTYNEGAAYNATPSIGSKNVNISGFTVATACNHSSHASNYFVMITVEKVSEEDNTPVYYSVSYEAGEGTGERYTDGELQFADEYTVDEFGFAAPEGKVFAGWKVTECEDNSAIYDINGNTYAAGDKFAMPAGNVTLTAQYVEDESKEEEGETISIPVKFYVLNPEKTVPLDGADQGINSYYPGGIVKNFRYYYEANIEGGLTDAFLAKLAASDGDNKLEIGDMLLVTSNEGIILPTDWKGLWTEFNISSENVNITAYVVKVQEALDYVGSNGNYYGYDDNGKQADIHVDCFVTNLSVKVSYHPNFEGAEDVYTVDAITGKVHEVFDYAETQLPENSGYKFIGWALSERGAVEYTADDNFTVVGNTDLYAKWEKIEEPEPEPVYYTVTYDPGEGTGESYADDGLEEKDRHTVDEFGFTAPVGFEFDKWVVTSAPEGFEATEFRGGEDFTMPAGDIVLTAVYKNVFYTVTYEAGAGSGDSYADEGLKMNDAYTVDEFGFTAPVGFEFDKWVVTYAPVEFEATEFRGGEDFTMPAGDIVLTAVYKNNLYTVTYIPGEGSGDVYADVDLKMGDAYTVDGNSFTAPVGFEFDKWVVTSAPEGFEATEFCGGENFIMPAGDIVLKAVWKEVIPEKVYYTVTYTPGEGSGNAYMYRLEAGYFHVVDANGFIAPEGKRFIKWAVISAPIGFSASEYTPAQMIMMPEGNIVLEAVWEDIPAVVPDEPTVDPDEPVVDPDEPIDDPKENEDPENIEDIPDEDVPTTDIPDEEVPKTGDASFLWTLALIISTGLLAVVFKKEKKAVQN